MSGGREDFNSVMNLGNVTRGVKGVHGSDSDLYLCSPSGNMVTTHRMKTQPLYYCYYFGIVVEEDVMNCIFLLFL